MESVKKIKTDGRRDGRWRKRRKKVGGCLKIKEKSGINGTGAKV